MAGSKWQISDELWEKLAPLIGSRDGFANSICGIMLIGFDIGFDEL